MAKRQLVAFVKRQRQRGLHDGAIAHALIVNGWSSNDVHLALQDHTAVIDHYDVDPQLFTFLQSHSNEASTLSFVDILVKQGWSVSAIKHTLTQLQTSSFHSDVRDHFLHKSKPKNFFSKTSLHLVNRNSDDPSVLLSAKHNGSSSNQNMSTSSSKDVSAGAHVDLTKEESLQERKLQRKLAQMTEEFKRKEAQLKLQEERMRDNALSSKIDDLKRMMAFNQQSNNSSSSGTNSSVYINTPQNTSNTFDTESSQQPQQHAPAVSLKTPGSNSPQPVYVVNQSKKKDQDMNTRFDAMLSQNNNYFAYTNPVVPEKLHLVMTPEDDRVQTGISGLDPIIEGGLLAGSATLVGGGPGTGKSTFCLQYLVNGILNYDEPGVYISFEESKQSIYNLGAQFNWPLEQLEKDQKLLIKEYTPEQIDKVLESGGGSVRDLIDSLGAKRVVIDSITAFMLLYEGEIAQRRACLQLFKSLSKWGCTTLAVAEEQGNVGKHSASVLEYETAAVVLLYNERKGDLRQRSLEIFKMRGTRHAGRIFPMRITERGVEVYPRETF